jgi:hypothetical protein
MPDNGWTKRNPEKAREYRKRWNAKNPGRLTEFRRNYHRKLRKAVVSFLGGKCARCNFSDERALQIDHVNGGGKQELKKIHGIPYLKKVLNDKTGAYQLLCANCNWIKRFENNELGGSNKPVVISD